MTSRFLSITRNSSSPSSLSKFYGLGSLRAGWAFAPAPLVEKARNFSDYLTPEMPFPSLYLAHLLLEHPLFTELETAHTPAHQGQPQDHQRLF